MIKLKKTLCEIVINNETVCKINGLKKPDSKFLFNKFRERAEGHFFNPLFKLGVWDGYIDFYSKLNVTSVLLLDEIIPIIVGMKSYKIKITDNRKKIVKFPKHITSDIFSSVIHPVTQAPLELREHQVASANALINETSGLVIAATSAGKTNICAAIAYSFAEADLSTIIIVPTAGLVTQTRNDFKFLGIDAGEYSGTKKEYQDKKVVVSTWQALQNNKPLMKLFSCVIVDEAHQAKSKELNDIVANAGSHIQFRYGVTATLPKAPADLLTIKSCLGVVRHTVTAKYLQEKGYIAKLDIEMCVIDEDFKKQYEIYSAHYDIGPKTSKKQTYKAFKKSYFPDYMTEKSYLRSNKGRIEQIAAFIEHRRDTHEIGNMFILVDSIAFGKALSELVPGSHFVSGKEKPAARQKVYDLFEDNDKLVVFATVHCAGVGISINRIFIAMLLDSGKSFIRTIQAIGRGLRMGVDKNYLTVIDLSSDLKYSTAHQKKRLEYYDETEYPVHKTKFKIIKKSASDLI